MQCSDCGYQLSPFDKDCPRCKVMSIKGTKPPTTPPIELNFDDHLIDRIEETKLKCANCNNPLECGWLACPKCGTQFETPVLQPSSGKSEAVPLPTVAPSSRSLGDGIIAGLIIIIVLGFLIVNLNKVTKGISSNTSSSPTQSTSDDPVSFSDLSLSQGSPMYFGNRRWAIEVTVHNNLSVPLKPLLVNVIFDDFSSLPLSPATRDILHSRIYSPVSIGPGKSAEWCFAEDDSTDNAAKKPKKLTISTDHSDYPLPLPPN